jgi:Cyclic nucleotide-binding domain/Major Facilitator Superfamily
MRMKAVTAITGVISRNAGLARLVFAYSAFVVSEYASWMAILVFAFSRGGATEAGLISVAQLIPAAVAAPWLAGVADRRSPARLLISGYSVQAVALAVTASGVAVGQPLVAYGAAIVSSIALVTTRPAQIALLPALAESPEDLTAANIALGWAENTGVVVAGLLAAGLLTWSGPAAVLAVTAALVLASVILVREVGHAAVPEDAGSERSAVSAVRTARLLVGSSLPRALVVLLSAQWVVVGALDVLYVVLAVDVLQRGEGWVGYLQTAFGVGGVAVSGLTARLVGRQLSAPILAAGLLLGVALAATALRPGSLLTALLIGVVGASRAVLDVSGRTLLQRAIPVHVLGGVFGLLEGSSMAGLAVGSLVVPLLITASGDSMALLGAGAIVPAVLLLCAGSLLRGEARTPAHTAKIALLKTVPLFAGLPPPVIEGLAGELQEQRLDLGTLLLREGEPGEHYFIIGTGQLRVTQAGRTLRLLGAGEAVGEIALLRDIPRTATVTAATASTVYRLDREPFLTAVTGHAPTQRTAETIVGDRLREDPYR